METLKDKIILLLTQEEARRLVIAAESFQKSRPEGAIPGSFQELFATIRKELLNA